MGTSLREIIQHLLDSMDERRQLQSLDPKIQQMLDIALERVIEGTDNRIQAVPGYRRKLYKSILKALEYVDSIIEQVPEPIDLTSSHFISDPYIRALFPTLGGLKRIFKQSSELQEYFSEAEHANDSESCALLCMRKQEQTVLGMELNGNQIRKDVKQTRVTFAGHRIYSPAETESYARRELKCCIFEGLVNNALDKISELRAKRHQLEILHQRLSTRLRSRSHGLNHVESFVAVASDGTPYKNEASELEKVEQELQEIGYVSPETCLELVNNILAHPEQYVRFKHISLNLDKEGVKRSKPESSPSISRLEFSEVKIKGFPPRVVTLARIRRADLEPPEKVSFDRYL
jgi:hypothetical protein